MLLSPLRAGGSPLRLLSPPTDGGRLPSLHNLPRAGASLPSLHNLPRDGASLPSLHQLPRAGGTPPSLLSPPKTGGNQPSQVILQTGTSHRMVTALGPINHLARGGIMGRCQHHQKRRNLQVGRNLPQSLFAAKWKSMMVPLPGGTQASTTTRVLTCGTKTCRVTAMAQSSQRKSCPRQ